MITGSGRQVWRDGGISSCPSLFDVGNGLARTARFAGQTKFWYSVLAHVLTCADLLPPNLRIYGLLHDAGESIVGDQVSTWKNKMTAADEDRVLERICTEIGVPWPWSPDIWDQVKYVDHVVLRAEAMILEHNNPRHSSFMKYPFHHGAEELTRERLLVPMILWTKWGYGGDVYEREVIEALRLAGLEGVLPAR